MGDFEDPATDARGGMEFLEVEGAMRWHQEGFHLVSIISRQSKLGTGTMEGL